MRFKLHQMVSLGLLLLTTINLSSASIFGGTNSDQPLEAEQAFRFSGGQTAADRLDFVWQIEPGYYLYQQRIELTLPPGVEQLARSDSATDSKDDPLFGQVEVFHNQAEVSVQIGRDSEAAPVGELLLSYQGCWEGGICYPPQTQQIQLRDIALKPLTPAPVAQREALTEPLAAPLSEQEQFFQTLSQASLLTLLGVFFLAGLALSLTPCVFPMIPILSGIIAGQGHRVDTRKGLVLSLVYVLAMAVTYTIAGVLAGLFGANLQAALQQPWVILLFSLIFVILALSMFGFFNLQFPSAFQTWLSRGSDRQRGGTYSGVAVMGFLSALIVGPCMAAPLAGALIYIGHTGDPILGGLALFVMSLGMGVPLLLIGTSAARIMPRAGRWMESVKAGFGVLLLLMAVWMLDRIVAPELTMAMVAVILLISSVYLGVLDPIPQEHRGWRRLFKGIGLILLIYGLALAIGLLSGGRSLIYPLKGVLTAEAGSAATELNFVRVTSEAALDQQLALANRNNRAVMLDYYADWCVSCDELDYVTFADAEVRRQLAQMVLIKVDVTAYDEHSDALLKRYRVLGPPTLLFYSSQGEYRSDLTLIGVPDPSELLANLARL